MEKTPIFNEEDGSVELEELEEDQELKELGDEESEDAEKAKNPDGDDGLGTESENDVKEVETE